MNFTHLQDLHQIFLSATVGFSSEKTLSVALNSVIFIQVWLAVVSVDLVPQSL